MYRNNSNVSFLSVVVFFLLLFLLATVGYAFRGSLEPRPMNTESVR